MRPREVSYDINTAVKFDILQSNNITKDDSKKKENYDSLKSYAISNIIKKEPESYEPTYNIPLHPPKVDNSKRQYASKGKPIKFHESASIVKLDPQVLGEINSGPKPVNFLNFMAMFEDPSELNEVNIGKLLGVDAGKICELQEKVRKIMQYVNAAGNSDGKNKAVSALKNIKCDLDENLENIESVIANVENIDKIIYGAEETKVVFQMK